LAKPNYQFKKRQKELAKKKKQEIKRQRKTDQQSDESEIQQNPTLETLDVQETS
jgi:hypothetical protein